MFARIVDFVSSPGKTRILNETIQRKLLPILRVQPGFVDEIVAGVRCRARSCFDFEHLENS